MPPEIPELAGPAVTIEPVCGVAAVFSEYAAGPASAATTAPAIAAACMGRASAGPNRKPAAAATSTTAAPMETAR